MPRVLLTLAIAFASIYAFIDCVQTDRRLVRVLAKPVWLLVVLVPALGPLFWLVAGRSDTRGGGRPPQGPTRPPGPIGPDDDPDFLRRL